MSKRHVMELVGMFRALFLDAKYAFPALSSEFDKDQARVERLVETRGVNALCVDLPALGKHFDRCLAEGAYRLPDTPLAFASRVSGTRPIPKFLRGLTLRVFDESTSSLKGDADVEALFFIRQILLAAKKAEFTCSRERVAGATLGFLATDASLPIPDEFWSGGNPVWTKIRAQTGRSVDQSGYAYQSSAGVALIHNPCGREAALPVGIFMMLSKVFDIMATSLGSYSYDDWCFKHGPGATSNKRLYAEDKYDFRAWSDELDRFFPYSDCGVYNANDWVVATRSGRIKDRVGMMPFSKLVAVPKTINKPRLIACEPVENQWCQQNVKHYLATRSENCWIGDFVRFRDQTLNQQLCLRASRDGSLATIDLSDASDRVTPFMVSFMFRSNPNLLEALRACRTQLVYQDLVDTVPDVGENPILQICTLKHPYESLSSKDDKLPCGYAWLLKKFSTMGSAVTFPIESLMFLGIALTATLYQRGCRKVNLRAIKALSGEVAVFGDDIIVPSDSRELLYALLETCWFRVNHNKSFGVGNFRESCGVDAFRGVNITPAYWHNVYTGDPESYVSTVNVANNFYSKFLVVTARYLESTLGRGTPPLVPVDSGYLGLKSYVKPGRQGLQSRWNKALYRTELRVPVVSSTTGIAPTKGYSSLLQFFSERPIRYSKWRGGRRLRPRLTRREAWVCTQELGLS